ncbi:MAG: putative DNA binding domain-containing protein [Candidatus Jorgensenbacteria bacterium]|nr:putative DNA binding domain-containing protein [Candidatus Jorgensenbacteria bacterium]
MKSLGDTVVTIKKSPFILVRTFIGIELLIFIAYLLVLGGGSYKYDLYTQSFFFSGVLPYSIAKLIFLAGVQLFVTIYAFARWYFESYSAGPGIISHQRGVFLKKNTAVSLKKSMTATVSSNLPGKLFHYGSIRIKDDSSGTAFVIADVSRPDELVETIEECINPERDSFTAPDVQKLLGTEEHEHLEFKSSLRFDHHSGKMNRDLEKAAMKTVAAFLNSHGGELVIGVNNAREPIGLMNDYQTLQHQNSDGFENHFTQVFNVMIGPEFRHLVKLWFPSAGQTNLCVVQTLKSRMPVYLKTDNDEHFYVRTGNTTTALKLSEIEAYQRSRKLNRTNQGGPVQTV